MTLIVKFHILDETFSIVKIVTDMQLYDCSIEVPLLITTIYVFSLVISKTSECFSRKKKVHCMIFFFFFAVDGARLKVILMKGTITLILNSKHKIQGNLLGYLYGT